MTYRFFMLTCSLLMLSLTLGCSGKDMTTSPPSPKTVSATAPFVIAGSGTNLPVTSKLAEGYYAKTGIKIDIPGSIGSDGAINAVKSGNLELGLISKHLSSTDQAAGLRERPYAQVAVVFGAHLQVPDSTLSTANIIEIIQGTKTTWSDGSKIHVFLRQNGDSSNLPLYEKIPGYKEALLKAYENHRWQIVYRDSDMSEALKENKGAFGITVSTQIAKEGLQTKALYYNGISPTTENIRNGSYPLTENLSFIYQQPISDRASKFLDYVFSEEGQQILNKWGSSPIGR